jgi:hypothetical protein
LEVLGDAEAPWASGETTLLAKFPNNCPSELADVLDGVEIADPRLEKSCENRLGEACEAEFGVNDADGLDGESIPGNESERLLETPVSRDVSGSRFVRVDGESVENESPEE